MSSRACRVVVLYLVEESAIDFPLDQEGQYYVEEEEEGLGVPPQPSERLYKAEV